MTYLKKIFKTICTASIKTKILIFLLSIPLSFLIVFGIYFMVLNFIIIPNNPLITISEFVITVYKQERGIIPVENPTEVINAITDISKEVVETTTNAIQDIVENNKPAYYLEDIDPKDRIDLESDLSEEDLVINYYQVNNDNIKPLTVENVAQFQNKDSSIFNLYVPKDHPWHNYMLKYYPDLIRFDQLHRPYYLITNNNIYAGFGGEFNLDLEELQESLSKIDPLNYGAIQTDKNALHYIIKAHNENFKSIKNNLTSNDILGITCFAIYVILLGTVAFTLVIPVGIGL